MCCCVVVLLCFGFYCNRDECKYYIKFTNKILDKGTDYVTNEISRLTKLSKSESITAEKRDNMLLRINVLTGFTEGSEIEANAAREKAEAEAAKQEL